MDSSQAMDFYHAVVVGLLHFPTADKYSFPKSWRHHRFEVKVELFVSHVFKATFKKKDVILQSNQT